MRALWSRPVAVSYVIFGINILVFLLMSFAGGTNNETTLLAFGMKSNYEIDHGEVWRFVTPIFIHIGFIHLFFNSYALWLVGPQVEKIYGGPRFLLLYLLTGIGGVAASYWYHPDIPSAGASGAIFGLFGVLLIFGLKYRSTLPTQFRQALSKGILLTVGINLVIGFSIPVVDNSAHLGGLISGAILASVIPYEQPGAAPRGFLKFIQAGLALVVAASFFQVASHYNGPPLSLRNLGRSFTFSSGSSLGEFIDAINSSQQAYERSSEGLSSTAGDLASAAADLGSAVEKLKRVPSISREADNLTRELLEIVEKQYEVIQAVERSGSVDFDQSVTARNIAARYDRWSSSFEKWVTEEGEHYGIVRTK